MSPTNPSVPRLLVSVRDADECLAALSGGADWIDLKEPNAGPLAAVDLQAARETADALAGRCTLSAALGELRDWQGSAAARLLGVPEISVVKLGLSGCTGMSDWQQQWEAVADSASERGQELVAVIYADWQQAEAPAPDEVLAMAQTSGSRYLLIDTYDKHAGSTFDHLTEQQLDEILQAAKQAALTTVLAGSISRQLIGKVPGKNIDMVAVRGAVCRGDRTSRVDAQLVEDFRQELAAQFGEANRIRVQ